VSFSRRGARVELIVWGMQDAAVERLCTPKGHMCHFLCVEQDLNSWCGGCRTQVLRESARKEFEAARFETDPTTVRALHQSRPSRV
jgi:hypothetical protein